MNQLYPKGKAHILGQPTKADLVADSIKTMLIHSATTPFNSAHEFVGDLVAGGIVARSGAMGGITVALGVFDANDVTLTSVSGANVDAIIVYKDAGSDATSVLLAWFDLSPAIAPTGTNMTINWDPSGIIAI